MKRNDKKKIKKNCKLLKFNYFLSFKEAQNLPEVENSSKILKINYHVFSEVKLKEKIFLIEGFFECVGEKHFLKLRSVEAAYVLA